MRLSDSIRRAMSRERLSADAFHKRVGIARSTLFNLLAGKQPELATLKKLRAAGVSIPRDLLEA